MDIVHVFTLLAAKNNMEYKLITHDKECFYKYFNPSVAKLVLNNLTVKWSSPSMFNDPFDLQVNLDFNFKMEELIEPLLDEVTRLTFSDEEPKGSFGHPLFLMTMVARENRYKSSPEKFREFMLPAVIEGSKNSQKSIEEAQVWWKEFCNNLRVFCVSEVNDDLLMWAHYAQNHEGVVLKFKCLREHDRPLCAAVPVKYQKDLPAIAGKDEYIRHLTGQEELPFDNMFSYFATTKSEHWAYEKEWRCIGVKRPDTEELFEFEKIIPEEIEAIYLGCKIKEQDRHNIESIVNKKLLNVSVFVAEKDTQKYGLVFNQIK